MSQQLDQHRQQASNQSLGGSHQLIYQKAIELFKNWQNTSTKHLDFGSGRGQFLSLLNQQKSFQQIVGVDLMNKPDGLAENINWQSQDLNNQLEFESGSFESVSALEIIEHLENPRHFFREISKILASQGTLIVSTPNVESWRSLTSYVVRGHFVDFTDKSYPAHITPLNRQDLKRAAQEAGFEVLAWDYLPEGGVPGMPSRSWQSLSFGVLKGLRFSDNIFLVLKKP